MSHPSSLPAVHRALRIAGAAVIAAVGAIGAGCAGPALQANMTDGQYQAVLAEDFPPGMTLQQVQSELRELHVPLTFSHEYPPTASGTEVFLVRTYPPTGPWPQFGPDSNVEFVDVSFVFGPDGRLQRTAIYRDGIRYGNGEVMDGPDRPTLNPPGKWMVGPPADPLQGAF